ncbi:MAG TPA: NlpC/P60 family protein [Nakamurella sp.]|nr:NlpC/P60 family protein [Nakamurella sp.]
MTVNRLARRGRRAVTLGVSLLLAGAVSISTALPAGALPPPPPNPSDQQIQASQDQAKKSSAEVGRLSGVVSKTQTKIQQLQDAMELKAELAMKARVDLDVAEADAADAEQAAKDAQHAATQAGTAIVTAKKSAAQFAAASFRQGSVLGSMSALLDSSSMDQLLARQQMIDQVSTTQLGVIATLESARTSKANMDSKAKAALDAAQAAKDRAVQAKKAADAAQAEAEKSFAQGQEQLAALQKQLTQQQADYQAALNKVADLKGQRAQYNAWVQAQQAEQERLARQAALQAEQARQARIAQQQAEQAQAEADALKARAVTAEQKRQAKILEEKIRKERERQAAIKRAQEAAARKAAAEAAARKAAADRARQQQNSSSGSSSSSSSNSGSSYRPPASNSSRGQRVVQAALAWLGTPYAWGGGTPSGPSRGIRDYGTADYYGDYNKIGFDCSGLALYAWAQVGVYLPHYSAYQYFSGQHVSTSNLQPGDLVFYAYNTSDPSTIHHVAIYMGNNQIVQAPQSGSYVMISPMRWSGYIGATRPGT